MSGIYVRIRVVVCPFPRSCLVCVCVCVCVCVTMCVYVCMYVRDALSLHIHKISSHFHPLLHIYTHSFILTYTHVHAHIP